MRPKLAVIRGGGAAGPAGKENGVRQVLIDRARSRLARGYYERPAVQRRLVDTLWEELFAEV
ncbi:MAG TPA: hypothetical protein VKF80_05510 [Candidatus Eisenbacteria bacterium]|nr:hypothetical protein [Candidatus Eisenbacteria bacterium]